MDAVGLEIARSSAEAFEHETARTAVLAAARRPRRTLLELFGVGRAVVGRQAHADEEHVALSRLRLASTIASRLARIASRLVPRRPSFAAEREHDDVGLMLLQCVRDARCAAGGGFAGDARVHYAIIEPLFAQARLRADSPSRLRQTRSRRRGCRRRPGSSPAGADAAAQRERSTNKQRQQSEHKAMA